MLIGRKSSAFTYRLPQILIYGRDNDRRILPVHQHNNGGVVQWNKTADSRYIETFLLASFLLERLSKNMERNTLIVGIAMVKVSAANSMQFKKVTGQDYLCSKLRSKTIQLV